LRPGNFAKHFCHCVCVCVLVSAYIYIYPLCVCVCVARGSLCMCASECSCAQDALRSTSATAPGVCVCSSECLYPGTLCRPVLSRYHQAGRKEVEREERRDEEGSESRAFTRGDVLGRGLPGSRMREEPSGCATTSTCCIPCFCSRPVRRTSKEEEKIPAGSSLSPASNSTWLTPLLRIVSSHVSNSWVSSRARAARCGTGSNPSEPSRLHSAAVSCFHKLFRTQNTDEGKKTQTRTRHKQGAEMWDTRLHTRGERGPYTLRGVPGIAAT